VDLGGTILDEAGGLVLDRRGTAIPLRAQSMKVLRLLARPRGEVVGKDDLIAAVWGDVHVTDDSLMQCIADIRRAIGDDGHRVLQTVHRRGYRLVPAEAPAEAPTAGAARRRRAWPVAVAALILAVLSLAAWTLRPAPVGAGLPRIAVLPFENLSGDPRWERLGRGLAAEIGTDLSRSRAIVVIPAETAQARRASRWRRRRRWARASCWTARSRPRGRSCG
jgi:DNA-binding winged helix-turn-helix (wHTH) protein